MGFALPLLQAWPLELENQDLRNLLSGTTRPLPAGAHITLKELPRTVALLCKSTHHAEMVKYQWSGQMSMRREETQWSEDGK